MQDAAGGMTTPLSKRVLASYGAPAFPLALVGLPMAVYLPAVYADPDGFGLTLGAVGLLLTLSRLTDVITDPAIGFLWINYKLGGDAANPLFFSERQSTPWVFGYCLCRLSNLKK